MNELFNIQGKTALITGGSQGIGKAIALGLAENGADIIINYRSGEEKALATQMEVQNLGVKCLLFPCDLSHENAAEEIACFVEQNNLAVDILILNASVQFRKPWNEVTQEEFDRHVNTNFKSSFYFIREFYPKMKEKSWGRIVTIGSVQQKKPHEQMIIYAASKVAQESLVRSLAPQFAPFGVTINNVAPGAIETVRNEEALADEAYKKTVESKIPAGFVGSPKHCAPVVSMLCSDAGTYITGQDIYVDGGMSLS